ncbi:tryptophan 7-halogenase [Gilvimarinus sp. SDUM040013]|uniref:Tryptophan halogenase family protein n=1 Tax=Gilvimarinus gilvus TaxID=3058038 RepID=A0ABU4RWN9_9GAMM|nr:tryptophan halogenase family protein [Gilvimarinus sp. SDUM040013]MDO3385662.1 tryptophan 7-halogenase [Gilvimarinus sp. SDUM040013]MDX6849300.1 tryptophan halogenase family protein [Gilvimarinus sp. SDUM040013]
MSVHKQHSAGFGSDNPVNSVVIVGGGTSGWMTAAGIARIAPPQTSITLVESEDIGVIGVGEATIPTLFEFNDFLGIKESDMLSECQGTFKLGIDFVDWLKKGQAYFHPFGFFGRDTPEFSFHQLWLRLRELAANEGRTVDAAEDINQYNLCTAAARLGRFAQPQGGGDAILSTMRYAYHFDSIAYGQMLRRYAEKRGVKRVEGTVVSVHKNIENGTITSVELEEGTRIVGDFFIDCSGFKSLLIEGAMASDYIDWSHYLPCDRAIALPTEGISTPDPFTRATADNAGWRWRIPLQQRMGNGYVYSSAHASEDDVYEKLMAGAEGAPLSDPKPLRFRTGHRQKFWEKNCVAIGLAGGFIEPLESTSIHLAQMGIQRLLNLWPGRGYNPAEIAHYNRVMTADYERLRDFIVLHYNATEREDTEFWRYVKNMAIPDSLQATIEIFKGSGRLIPSPEDLFTPHSWLAVMLGQGIYPKNYDKLVEQVPSESLAQNMQLLRDSVSKTAAALPTHSEYIRRYCAVRSQ